MGRLILRCSISGSCSHLNTKPSLQCQMKEVTPLTCSLLVLIGLLFTNKTTRDRAFEHAITPSFVLPLTNSSCLPFAPLQHSESEHHSFCQDGRIQRLTRILRRARACATSILPRRGHHQRLINQLIDHQSRSMLTLVCRLRCEYTELARHLGVLHRAGRCLPAACGICLDARTQRPGATAPGVCCSHVVRSLWLHPPRCRGKSKLRCPSTFLAPNTGYLCRATSCSTTQLWPQTVVFSARCGRSTRYRTRAT